MQKKIYILLFSILLLPSIVSAQYSASDSTYKKCFVGSSLFMLFNLIPEERPDFFQLNFGYRISSKDVVSLELKTWRYFQSLGIAYGDSFNIPENKFPGFIREYGFALAYQRFWWKGLYSAIHSMPAWQSFINTGGEKIDKGFQIFNTYRLGYHFKIFSGRFFIEPSFAITHRAYHTEMPKSFKVQDENHSKFFYAEPGLHFGYNF